MAGCKTLSCLHAHNCISNLTRSWVLIVLLLSDLCACQLLKMASLMKTVFQWPVQTSSSDFEVVKKRWGDALLSVKWTSYIGRSLGLLWNVWHAFLLRKLTLLLPSASVLSEKNPHQLHLVQISQFTQIYMSQECMLTCGGAATIKMMSSCALDNYAINGIHAHLKLGPISIATVAYSQCVVSNQFISRDIVRFLLVSCASTPYLVLRWVKVHHQNFFHSTQMYEMQLRQC